MRLHLAVTSSAAIFFTTAVVGQRQEMWFPTGQPAFVEPRDPVDSAQQRLMTRAAYDRLVEQLTNPALVPIHEFPGSLSPNARFGINFIFADKNCGFVVDGDATRGYTLYADLHATGSLLDDAPVTLERREGYYTALIKTTASETNAGETTTYPVIMRLVVVPSADGELKHALYQSTIRRGTAQVGGRRVAFNLNGRNGVYDEPTFAVWIDLNGDGRGFDEPNSPEVFHVREQRVNIDGTGYQFRVDHYGRGLVLMPLGKAAQERPSLKPGTSAPDFSLVDIDGHPQSLKQYHGRVVLIDFWAIWCSPCKAEAPTLKAIYHKYRDAGFAIIGIAPDGKDEIRKYIGAEGNTWTQMVEADDGAVHQLFRVVGYPTHVLVGRDGKIIMSESGDIADTSTSFENLVKQAVARKP